MCVRARVCACVCVRVYMQVCMYVCVCMYASRYVYTYVCIYIQMSACMYVCMYVCIHACMHVFMYVCIYWTKPKSENTTIPEPPASTAANGRWTPLMSFSAFSRT
jgi:hypothetical protein